VGHARIPTAALAAPAASAANITLEYCEAMADVANGTCYRMAQGYAASGVVDTHTLPAADTSRVPPPALLATLFSWHSFAFVVVRANAALAFHGGLEQLHAVTTRARLEATANVTFAASPTLTRLALMAATSAQDSMASYLPGMDPMREKHAWLGDAFDAGELCMVAYDAAPLVALFLDTASDGQAGEPAEAAGNVPVAVPCHGGPDLTARDLSWTSGFALLTRWFVRHYGTTDVAHAHWAGLDTWAERKLSDAGGSLPTAFTYGDDGEIDARAAQPPPPQLSPDMSLARAAGPAASGGNFILAADALAELATLLALPANVTAHFAAVANGSRATFDRLFWNASLDAYSVLPSGIQTLSSLALSVGAVPPVRRSLAVAALLRDVAFRGNATTVGSVGQRTILRTLSALGPVGHAAALAMATRPSFPGWGWWAAQNATTCWEHWAGTPTSDTHNHVWMCGGLGTWLYADVAGLWAAGEGWAWATIAPKTTPGDGGPSAASLSVATRAGMWSVTWSRENGDGALMLSAGVPPGAVADVQLPLVCAGTARAASVSVSVDGGSPVVVWKAGEYATAHIASSWPLGVLNVTPPGAAGCAPWGDGGPAGRQSVLCLALAGGLFDLRLTCSN
jgi:hypothetical protein